ncbi:MAG: uroporphyrinogen decarboxylase family protein, partial [Armatimonadota bacterium]
YERFAPGEDDPVVATAKVFNGLRVDMCRGVYMPQPPGSEGQEIETETHRRKISGKTNWVVEYPIKTLDDVRAWKRDLPDEEALWPETERAAQIRDTFAPETLYVPGCGVGFHATYGMMGLQLFSTALYDARDDIERIIATLNAANCLRARLYARANLGPLFFVGDDIAYKGRTMLSPAMMRQLFFPYLKRLCEPLVQAGIKVVFHTDGYVMDIVDDLLDCGIAGLNPLEPLAGNDIAALKKRYGRNLILVGGMDCSQLLPLGSVADVRQGTKQLLRDAGRGGGLFIGSSSEIVPSTPVENILAFYEACCEFGRYPLRL